MYIIQFIVAKVTFLFFAHKYFVLMPLFQDLKSGQSGYRCSHPFGARHECCLLVSSLCSHIY